MAAEPSDAFVDQVLSPRMACGDDVFSASTRATGGVDAPVAFVVGCEPRELRARQGAGLTPWWTRGTDDLHAAAWGNAICANPITGRRVIRRTPLYFAEEAFPTTYATRNSPR
jgi:hypothetical protein